VVELFAALNANVNIVFSEDLGGVAPPPGLFFFVHLLQERAKRK